MRDNQLAARGSGTSRCRSQKRVAFHAGVPQATSRMRAAACGVDVYAGEICLKWDLDIGLAHCRALLGSEMMELFDLFKEVYQ